MSRTLNEFDVFVRDSRALPVLRRVLARGEEPMSAGMSVRDPFGPALGSNFTGFSRTRRVGDVRLYMNQDSATTELWADRSKATRNLDLIDRWKVFVPKAGPGSSGGHVIPDVVIGRAVPAPPESVCTATYLVIGPLNSTAEAESVSSYLRTRFARFLIALRKPSQNTTRESYLWVPQQEWDHAWTDEELYAKYGITEEEQAYIAEMVREMET